MRGHAVPVKRAARCRPAPGMDRATPASAMAWSREPIACFGEGSVNGVHNLLAVAPADIGYDPRRQRVMIPLPSLGRVQRWSVADSAPFTLAQFLADGSMGKLRRSVLESDLRSFQARPQAPPNATRSRAASKPASQAPARGS